MYQGSELGSLRYDSGMIWAWFRVWFGNPLFFEFGKLCCLSLFFPPSTYYDCYLMAAMARPARRPWTGPEYQECEDLNVHLWFISAGLPASLLDVLLMYGFFVWLPASQPASQPATAGVIPLISLISNTASSQPRSQPAATSQPYSQPPNQQQQLSQPPSQPASHPEPASLGIMMRLCARGEDSPLREGMCR